MQQAYRSFLTALTESKAGQSYESLEWAGESLLTLDAGAEAEKVLQRVLDDSISNPEFLKQPGGKERMLRTKLSLRPRAARGRTTEEVRRGRLAGRGAARPVPTLHRAQDREGHAPGSPGRGRPGRVVGRAPPLGRPGPEALPHRPGPSLFRRLVSRGLRALQQKQTTKARQTLSGIMRLNPERRRPRDEGEVRSSCWNETQVVNSSGCNDYVNSATQIGKRVMPVAVLLRGRPGSGPLGGPASADDVVLIPGSTVKQAIGGRVRGQVAVGIAQRGRGQAGREHDLRADRPDRVDPLRRPVGDAPARRDPRGGRPACRGGRPLQESGRRVGRQAVRLADGPLSRGRCSPTWPWSSRRAQGRQGPARPVRANLSDQPHIIPAREALARIQFAAGDFKGAEATIAELAKLPQGGDRAAVLRAKVLAKQGTVTTRRSPSSIA